MEEDSVKILKLLELAEQSKPLDSTLLLLRKAKKLTRQGERFYSLYYQAVKRESTLLFRNGRYGALETVQREFIAVTRAQKDSSALAKAYKNFGLACQRQGKNEMAEQAYDTSLLILKAIDDAEQMVYSLNSIANLYEQTGRPTKAIEAYLQALDFALQTGNALEIALVDENIGILHFHQRNYDKALEYYQQALKYLQAEGGQREIGGAHNNIASVHYARQEYNKAIEHYQQAIEYNLKGKNQQSLAYSYNDLGAVYKEIGRRADSRTYLKKALAIRQEINDLLGQVSTLINLANLAIEMKQPGPALQYLEQAEEINDKVGNPNIQLALLESLSEAYLIKGDPKKSRDYLFRAHQLKDTLIDEQHSRAIQEMESRFQRQQQQMKIQLLETEQLASVEQLRRQQYFLWAVGLGLALVMFSALFLAWNYRRQKRYNLQLAAKNAQIHLLNRELSHRVKNNLQFVSSLLEMQARRADSKDARAALQESETRLQAMALLHRRLYQQEEGATTVELGSYLEELCGYLQSTYPAEGPPPEIHTEIEPIQADAEQAGRLGLIVNELLTNSFKHAFDEVGQPEVFLGLQKTEDGNLRLSYRDNGKGMPVGYDVQNSRSLGLKLIHTLSRQLSGSVKVSSEPGARYEFEFQGMKKNSINHAHTHR